MTTAYTPITDTWVLSADPLDPVPGAAVSVSKSVTLDDGGVVVTATSLSVPTSGAYGVLLRNSSEVVRLYFGHFFVPPPESEIINAPTEIMPATLALSYLDNTVNGSYSLDGVSWEALGTLTMAAAPTHAEIFIEQYAQAEPVSASFQRFRVLPGVMDIPPPIAAKTFLPIGALSLSQPPALTPTEMSVIHALVGAQFGDLEFDVGKSVRWTQWFVDDVFITDVNYGTQRFWVIDWTQSFANANYKSAGVNFFEDPVAFRKRQFSDAETYAKNNPDALVFDSDDWVLWVDAHEGLSADNEPPYPPDSDFEVFRPYIAREIERAVTTGKDRIILPFFAYVRHGDIQNVQYDWVAGQAEGGPKVTQAMGVPYYIPYQGLVRLVKVSALRSPSFNWSSIDQVSPPDPEALLQIVSYGYAHWSLPVVPPGANVLPPIDAENDLGWRQRNLLSQVRPVPGLPHGDTWLSPSSDSPGLAGPWAPDTFANDVTGVIIPEPRPPIDPAVDGVRVPLYHTVFRLNLRDGAWYAGDGLGNEPLVWDEVSQSWRPVDAVGDYVETVTFVESPPGSGLYAFTSLLPEDPPGLYLVSTLIEDPVGSGLYKV